MILHVVHYTSNNRLDSSKSKTVSKNIFDKLTYFLQLSVLLKKSKITDTSCWLSINIYFHSSVPLCSLSELSITSGMTQASSRWLDLSWVDHAECVCVCRSCPRYHRTETTWAQTPTTLAPARHWQYHPVAVHEECSIHRRYCLPEIWRLWILTRRTLGISWITIMM